MRFLHNTGLRAAELCNMQLNDLDFSSSYGGKVKVLGKGDKIRSIPFSMKARLSLAAYLAPLPERQRAAMRNARRRAKRNLQTLQEAPRANGLKIWTSRYGTTAGQALTVSGLRKIFERLGKDAGIHGVRCSPHTMRHCFAVTYLRNDGKIEALQEPTGHEKMDTTRRYVKLANFDMERDHRLCSPGDSLGI